MNITNTPVKHLPGFPLWGRLLALPTKIRLSWKGSQGANTLACFENWSVRALKRFTALAPGQFLHPFVTNKNASII